MSQLLQARNPFTERGRITNPEHFIGRWRELSLLFDRIETRRPVLVSGVPGIGRSSLLTHVVQSAGANFDDPDLAAFYLDLTGVAEPNQIFRTVTTALNAPGDTLAALEMALIEAGRRVVLCLDNAEYAVSQEWGELFLEQIARMARSGGIMLVVGVHGEAPVLSERYARIILGAFQASEVRMLVEAYLEGTNIQFSPREVADIGNLSAGHPAYAQRAAYHVFEARRQPGYNWRAAYLAEARERPVPGAPLPPSVFEGEDIIADALGAAPHEIDRQAPPPPAFATLEQTASLVVVGLIATGCVLAVSGQLIVGLAVAMIGIVVAILTRRAG